MARSELGRRGLPMWGRVRDVIHSHDLIRGEYRCSCGVRFPTVALAMQHAQSRNAPTDADAPDQTRPLIPHSPCSTFQDIKKLPTREEPQGAD